jgi:hypothetical protein
LVASVNQKGSPEVPTFGGVFGARRAVLRGGRDGKQPTNYQDNMYYVGSQLHGGLFFKRFKMQI